MANTGTGGTIAFTGAVTLAARWRSLDGLQASVEMLDDTALSTTGYKRSVPDDLADTDPISGEIYFPATVDLLGQKGKQCTVTITWPVQTGNTIGAKITGTAVITQVGLPRMEAGQRLMCPITLKFDGQTGPTFTAGG